MAYRNVRPDGLELQTSRSMRSPSISSDLQSASGRSVAAAPPPVNPPPVYIASTGASQLVSTEIGNTVMVAEQALILLNDFLDQILYNLLSSAHSVDLGQLKATVPIILKPRLGKAALKAADEELREYLEDDEDDTPGTNGTFDPKLGFDLELAWKLARLRCMVYTRLGDLEEEDEEEYVEQEQLHERDTGARRSVHLAPGSAIFLTSVLEYLGEQALFYAAQHAQKRAQTSKLQDQPPNQDSQLADASESLSLEEVDMFQVGRESPLSRLWRSWRRNMRSTREPSSRPLSPETLAAPATLASPSETPSFGTRKENVGMPSVAVINEEHRSLGEVLESKSPSQLPLPMSDRDVDEIEVPGLAPEIVDEGEEPRSTIPIPERSRRRPVSMMIAPGEVSLPPSPTSPDGPNQSSTRITHRPKARHTRSYSMPTPAQTPFTSPRHTLNPEADPDEVPRDEGEQVEDEHPLDENATDQHKATIKEPEPEAESSPATDREHEQLGKVAAAVSAVAGALGFGAIAASHGMGEDKAKEYGAQREVKPAKTVAEEFIGPTTDVPPPKDAVTGASITTVGDFDSIHVPLERAPPGRESVPVVEAETSDPEDLALSSADEEPAEKSQDRLSGTQNRTETQQPKSATQKEATSTGTSFYHDTEEGDGASAREAPMTASPSSPARSDQASRRANREAKIYPQSPGTSTFAQSAVDYPSPIVRAPVEPDVFNKPMSAYQSVTTPAEISRPSTARKAAEVVQSPISPMDEVDMFVAAPSRPGTAGSASAASPAGLSSGANKAGSHLSKSSQYSQHSKSSSSSSKLLGFDREQHSRSQQSSRGGDGGMISTNGVRSGRSGSTSLAKEAQVPVTGSPKPSSQRLKLQTNSEERRPRHSPADSVDEVKKKSLEVLINSDETLHYTLTPASARSEKFPIPPKHTTQTQDLADFFRTTKPPNEEAERPRTARSAISAGFNGLRSNPAQPESSAPPVSSIKVVPSPMSAIPADTSSLKPRSVLGGPRDPRVDQTTMRDLADYARSTGPESTGQLPKPLTSSTSPAVTAAGIAAATAYTRSAISTPQYERPPGTSASASSRATTTQPGRPGSRLKYQARDPRPSQHAETSDLIDFIREGPPRAPGEHRIDRNVAPFRRTMDSDDLNNLAPERDQNATSSVASTQNSSVAARSMQESLNSRTALLDSSNRSNVRQVNGHRAPAAATLQRSALAEENGMPKRNQRRIRDPYAIDDSDDDMEDIVVTPRPKTQDESLIDFLRNTAPPPGMTSQPIMAATTSMASSSTVRNETSNSALKDRILRKASVTGASRNGNSTKTIAAPESDAPPGYNRATNGAREESPHLSQVGSKLDSYRPTQPTHAAHMDRPRQKARAPMESRDARSGGDTRDLAAYLKASGPPTPPASSQRRSIPIKEEAGFLKFFSRRRSSVKK